MKADLHIHTCLSPCGELEMTPQKIVQQAREKELSLIGICDHHTAQNVAAVARAADGKGICVIPGMEINTLEEVHVVALFGDMPSANAFEEIISSHLPQEENDEDVFGLQVIANEHDEVEGFNKRLLIGSVDLSLSQVIEQIHRQGGIAIAAHIDRQSYSVIQQLGFIPPDLKFDALEVSPNLSLEKAREVYKEYNNYTLISSSDAHHLRDIGKSSTCMLLESADFRELCLALSGGSERMVRN